MMTKRMIPVEDVWVYRCSSLADWRARRDKTPKKPLVHASLSEALGRGPAATMSAAFRT